MAKDKEKRKKKDKKKDKKPATKSIRGFRMADTWGRRLERMQEKTPITKSNGTEWLKFVRGMRTVIDVLETEVLQALGMKVATAEAEEEEDDDDDDDDE